MHDWTEKKRPLPVGSNNKPCASRRIWGTNWVQLACNWKYASHRGFAISVLFEFERLEAIVWAEQILGAVDRPQIDEQIKAQYEVVASPAPIGSNRLRDLYNAIKRNDHTL